MIIRPEKPADRPAVRTVVEAAFPMPAEAQLVDQLRAEGDAEISLVAVDDDVIVGHVMFSRMTAEFRALGLGPVAVLPDRQRSRVGAGSRNHRSDIRSLRTEPFGIKRLCPCARHE